MHRNILLLIFITFLGSCLSNKDVIVVGHRGAMGHALENTVESVKKAIEWNVDGIEIDVFKSKTGELVVYHDPFLTRLSNSNAFIEEISLDSIKKVKLVGGLSIPTLNEVIDIIPENIFLNIELKGKNTALETNKIIIEHISKFSLPPSKFIISSFRWDELIKFRNANQDVPIAILVDSLYKIDAAIKIIITDLTTKSALIKSANMEKSIFSDGILLAVFTSSITFFPLFSYIHQHLFS